MNILKSNFLNYKYLVIFAFTALIFSCKNGPSSATTVGDYTSKMTKPDKKKYYNSSNTVVYEVKYKEDGFKLRSPSSDLLWKVKLYENKIKISDNEENLNPFEIKKLDNGESKLEKNDTTLERSTADEAHNLVRKISDIPQDQQEILISELTAKGF